MHNLTRFLEAQPPIYKQALAELKQGRKRTHWMWFIFPQIAGLGNSAMNRKYAIQSFEEASAYVNHPILGTRLIECSEALLNLPSSSAYANITDIMGYPDDMKLKSSLTLFECVSDNPIFGRVLDRYFGEGLAGRCGFTLELQ